MKRLLKSLKLIFFLMLSSTFLYADEYVADSEDANVSANINIDNFSSIEITPNKVEIGMEGKVCVSLSDYLGKPVINHSIRLYTDDDSAEITFIQPENTDVSGKSCGFVKAMYPGAYKVMAIDDTYGYDIYISNFAIFYTIPLETPVLLPEPYYTKSTVNTIKWESDDNYKYYAEVGTDPSFLSVIGQSGWISSSQYTFTDLEDGVMYYYRLKKKNLGGGESDWSNVVYSVQDASAPVVNLISIENIDDELIRIKADIKDNFSIVSLSVFCIHSDGSLYKCSSKTLLSGSIYTADISLDNLEKNKYGKFFNEYSFCIEASDEAGNFSRNCNISILLVNQANIIESRNELFSFEKFVLHPLIYIPSLIVNNMSNIMTKFEMSITSLLISSVIFLVFLILYFGNISTLFLYVIYNINLFFKKDKQYRLKGIVYDSFSKEPIKYALVKVYDKLGKRVGWSISNEDGEFDIELIQKGVEVNVFKNNYVFPSNQIAGKSDYPYLNIYIGGIVNFRNSSEVYISIPIDPKQGSFLLIELKRSLNILMLVFLSLLFLFSIFLSFFLFSGDMTIFNFLLLIFNIFDAVLLVNLLLDKVRREPEVKDVNGKPVQGISVVIKDVKSGKILGKRVTKRDGKYSFNLESGEYILDILNPEFSLIAVKEGRELEISKTDKRFFGKDMIVEKK